MSVRRSLAITIGIAAMLGSTAAADAHTPMAPAKQVAGKATKRLAKKLGREGLQHATATIKRCHKSGSHVVECSQIISGTRTSTAGLESVQCTAKVRVIHRTGGGLRAKQLQAVRCASTGRRSQAPPVYQAPPPIETKKPVEVTPPVAPPVDVAPPDDLTPPDITPPGDGEGQKPPPPPPPPTI